MNNKLEKLEKKRKHAINTINMFPTNTMVEKVIISSCKKLTIRQLENIRYLINQEIKIKKIMKRIHDKTK